MSYKSEFASNNVDLQTILDMVNGLPDKKTTVDVKLVFTRPTGPLIQGPSVTIGGTVYDMSTMSVEPGTTVEKIVAVEIGTEIKVDYYRGDSSYAWASGLYYHGERKDDASASGTISFTFTATEAVAIYVNYTSGSAGSAYSQIAISGINLYTVLFEMAYGGSDAVGTVQYMKNGVLQTEEATAYDDDGTLDYSFELNFEADKGTIVCAFNLTGEAGGVEYHSVTGGTLLSSNEEHFVFSVESGVVRASG